MVIQYTRTLDRNKHGLQADLFDQRFSRSENMGKSIIYVCILKGKWPFWLTFHGCKKSIENGLIVGSPTDIYP